MAEVQVDLFDRWRWRKYCKSERQKGECEKIRTVSRVFTVTNNFKLNDPDIPLPQRPVFPDYYL